MTYNRNYKKSKKLNFRENALIMGKLHSDEKVLCTCQIDKLLYKNIDDLEWKTLLSGTGALCFVMKKEDYMFKLYELIDGKVLWEHLYTYGMDYVSSSCDFHSLVTTDRCYFGFKIAYECEAASFLKAVQTGNKDINVWSPITEKKPKNVFSGIASLFKRHEMNFGTPQNFQHLTSISGDPSKCFNLDPELQNIFEQAGITQTDLSDPKLATALYKVLVERDICEESNAQGKVTPEMFKLKKNVRFQDEVIESVEILENETDLFSEIEEYIAESRKNKDGIDKKVSSTSIDSLVDALVVEKNQFAESNVHIVTS